MLLRVLFGLILALVVAGSEGEWETKLVLSPVPARSLRLVWTKTSLEEPLDLFFVQAGIGGDVCGKEQLELAEHGGLESLVEDEHLGQAHFAEVTPAGMINARFGLIRLKALRENTIATYRLSLPLSNCTCLFAKHARSETGLFIVDEATGIDAVLAYEEEEEPEAQKPYAPSSVAGAAMGGALVVCILPIAVILLCAPFALLRKRNHIHLFFHFMNAFGFGALISVVTLHLYPEMVLSLNANNLPAWQGGATVLGGICAVAFIHVIADNLTGIKGHAHDPEMGFGKTSHSHSHGHSHGSHDDHHGDVEKPMPTRPESKDTKEVGEPSGPTVQTDNTIDPESLAVVDPAAGTQVGVDSGAQDAMDETTVSTVNALRWGTWRDLCDFRSLHPLVWGIIIGDGLHNFVDGTIIATAFLTCGPVTGWTTVAATVAHEVPSELGNFAVMLSKGVTVGQGLFFNLLAQCTALLGCSIVLAIGNEIPESQTSLLLAFGIGTFLFISLTDIMPLVLEVREKHELFAGFCGMMLAFTAIGLSTMGGDSCGEHSH